MWTKNGSTAEKSGGIDNTLPTRINYMTVNGREMRRCCSEDPLLRIDTLRSSYAVHCAKCKKRSIGLSIIGAVEAWNNKDVQ